MTLTLIDFVSVFFLFFVLYRASELVQGLALIFLSISTLEIDSHFQNNMLFYSQESLKIIYKNSSSKLIMYKTNKDILTL